MRLFNLIGGDVRFQWHYGFYGVYAIFTALYLLVLFAVPESARRTLATVLIYSDPAAMGLFFMGAIVLLEKSQRVNCAICVSPVKTSEYVASKVISLAAVGLIVGLLLSAAAGSENLLFCAVGIVLASALCSLCGLIVAMKVSTLNQFIIAVIPIELIVMGFPALLLFGVEYPLMVTHPGIAAVYLIYGRGQPALCVLSLLGWIGIAYVICCRVVKKSFLEMGGATL